MTVTCGVGPDAWSSEVDPGVAADLHPAGAQRCGRARRGTVRVRVQSAAPPISATRAQAEGGQLGGAEQAAGHEQTGGGTEAATSRVW